MKTAVGIHITDIEAAINYWRQRKPSPDGVSLGAELRALASAYAQMIYFHQNLVDEYRLEHIAYQAWYEWYLSTPDTPCIAICSTSQGDSLCKGCGRSEDEVRDWTEYTPAEKRQVWRRILLLGQAWRFNRYQERSLEGVAAAKI